MYILRTLKTYCCILTGVLLLFLLAGCTGSPKHRTATGPATEQARSYSHDPGRQHTADSIRIDSIAVRAGDIRFVFPDSALFLLDRAFAYSEEKHFHTGMARALMVKALVWIEKNRYEKALQAMDQAKAYINNDAMMIIWHTNLAVVYSYTDEYRKQLSHYMQALRLLDKKESKNELMYISLYINISHVWSSLGDLDKSDAYVGKALRAATQLPAAPQQDVPFKLQVLSTLYNTAAANYLDRQQYDKALLYLQKSLEVSNQLPSLVKSKRSSYILLSDAYSQLGAYRKAFDYIDHYNRITDTADRYGAHVMPNMLLSGIYLQKKQYSQALQHADSAINNARLLGINNATKVRTAYEVRAKALAGLGRSDEAVKAYQALLQLVDSNLSQEKLQTNRKMDFLYQVTEKDRKLSEQRLLLTQKSSQLKSQKIVIVLAAAGLIISLLLLYLFRNRQQLQKKAFLLYSKENELKYQKELMAMEEQQRRKIGAELHDGISGTLAAIKMNLGTVRKNFPGLQQSGLFTETQDMLKEATDEVRQTAHHLIPEMLLKNGLNEALITYINRVVKDDKLTIDYNYFMQEEQPLRDEVNLILFRIVQELLQNILNHSRARKAIIQLLEVKGKVHLIVEDNGTGFDTAQSASGIGLYNIKVRVLSLEGQIDIQSHPGRHTVIRISFGKEQLI